MTADWIVCTTLRRRWPDGTEFAIRRAGLCLVDGFHLTVTHPVGLKAHSHHPTIELAKAHAEEMMDSFGDAAKPKPRRDMRAWRPGYGFVRGEVESA